MKTPRLLHPVVLAVCALGFPGAVVAAADDVTEELDAAREAYEKGNIAEAIQALDLARQLMMQKTAGDMAQLFPEDVEGLERGEPESSAAGQAMFGGMVTAECRYTAESGDGSATVRYTAKSPALQSVMMMFSMPGITGNTGMKIERVAGKRALVEREGNTGRVQIVYENELLVEIEFDELEWDTVTALVGEIPWDQLGELLLG